MKKLLFLLCVVVAGSMFYSCEKDNLEGPDAIFAGELRDPEDRRTHSTGDIGRFPRLFHRTGVGDNPPVQNMVVKKDGTFYNGMIFSGDYKIILNRGNYVPLDTLDMKIKPGKNYQVFEVNPYLRIIEPEISVIGRKVVAKFKLEQVTSNEVYRISLFAHSHIDVSNKLNIVNRTEELNRSITDGEAFELSINLDDYTSTLVPGKSYYFRIGAQSHGSETKYNYSASVQLDI